MDWKTGLSASSLEAGVVVQMVRGRAFVWRRKFHKKRVMVQQRFDNFKVVGDVGPHVEQAARGQSAGDSIRELVREKSATAMFPFPPRIWEVNVDPCQGFWPDNVFQQVVGIAADDARVGLLTFEEPLGSAAALMEVEFNAKEVSIGLCGACIEQKHSASTADVEFDGICIAEHLWPVDPTIVPKIRREIIKTEKVRAQVDHFGHRNQLGSPLAAPR